MTMKWWRKRFRSHSKPHCLIPEGTENTALCLLRKQNNSNISTSHTRAIETIPRDKKKIVWDHPTYTVWHQQKTWNIQSEGLLWMTYHCQYAVYIPLISSRLHSTWWEIFCLLCAGDGCIVMKMMCNTSMCVFWWFIASDVETLIYMYMDHNSRFTAHAVLELWWQAFDMWLVMLELDDMRNAIGWLRLSWHHEVLRQSRVDDGGVRK